MSAAADPVLGFEPRSATFRAEPYPVYQHLLKASPVCFRAERDDWIVTAHKFNMEVLKNENFGRAPRVMGRSEEVHERRDRGSSERTKVEEMMLRFMFLNNPPTHTRLRDVMRQAFTPAKLTALRPQIEQTLRPLLDHIEDVREFEVIADLSHPLALSMNCVVLGLTDEWRHASFRPWMEAVNAMIDVDTSPVVYARGIKAFHALAEHFKGWIDDLRSTGCTTGGMIDALLAAEAAGVLSPDEVLANAVQTIFAGYSPTKNLIANTLMTLTRHPDQWQRLRGDPGLVESAVTEVARFESPIQAVFRTALADSVVGGQTIARGQGVVCVLGAGNRDPQVFADPDRFNVGRAPNPYLSFSRGIHSCLGWYLGRTIVEMTLSEVVRRFPAVRLADEAAALDWRDVYVSRGLKALRLRG